MEFNKKDFITGVEAKYDKRLLQGRIENEGNLIGCFLNDVTLLQDAKLSPKQFLTSDGRFYYSLISSLVNKGYGVIDEVGVLSAIGDKEDILEAFNKRGGYDTLEHLASVVNKINFDAYLEQFNKSNLLCEMHLDGWNLFNEITIKNKKVVPFDLFQKMKTTDIVDFWDSKLASYNLGSDADVCEEEDIFFEDDWEDNLELESEMGVPYDVCGVDVNGKPINGFKFLSNQTLGLHKGGLMMLAGFSGCGKSTAFVTLIMALLYRGEKIVILSNEERCQAFKVKFMSFLLARHNRYRNATKSKLSVGDLTNEDRAEIKKAKKYFNDNFKGSLKFISLNTNDIHLIKKKIRDAHLREGYTGFLLDTFKLNDSAFDGDMRQDLSLVKDSRELHSLAKKYNLIGMCSCQCGERFKGMLTLNASVLANSKQSKEILNLLLMCRSLYPEELDPKSKYYCEPFRLIPEPNGKGWREEPYEVDKSGTYLVVAVEKNRYGTDTSSNSISYLLQFEGHLSTFREVAQIRTKHGMIQ